MLLTAMPLLHVAHHRCRIKTDMSHQVKRIAIGVSRLLIVPQRKKVELTDVSVSQGVQSDEDI